MLRSLDDLHPGVRQKALAVQEGCIRAGFELLIYATYRPLEEQARAYRQSRATAEVVRKADLMRSKGFGKLADILINVGPVEHGAKITNAAPGEGLHSYRLAFDAVPIIHGKPAWSYAKNKRVWEAYGRIATDAGLNWSGGWKSFKEYAHCQDYVGANPLNVYTPAEVHEMLGI